MRRRTASLALSDVADAAADITHARADVADGGPDIAAQDAGASSAATSTGQSEGCSSLTRARTGLSGPWLLGLVLLALRRQGDDELGAAALPAAAGNRTTVPSGDLPHQG